MKNQPCEFLHREPNTVKTKTMLTVLIQENGINKLEQLLVK